MSVTLVGTSLRDNTWLNPIDKRKDVIGLFSLDLNLLLEVKSTGGASPPPFISVKVEVKELQRALSGQGSMTVKGKTSIPQPAVIPVPRFGLTSEYRLNLPHAGFALMMVPDSHKEVATVVRAGKGATADVSFTAPLVKGGWAQRGFGRQPSSKEGKSAVTGTLHPRRPDATALMLAGGVEVIEITAPPQKELVLQDAHTWAFLRSPADLFFYTGHGMGGNLVLDPNHETWLTPEELLAHWGR